MRRFLIVLRRAFMNSWIDGCFGIAKGAAYSGLLALFPVLSTVVLANPEVADKLGVVLHPSIPLFASVGGAGGGFLGFLSPANGASA